MSEQFNRIGDYARQSAVLADPESLRATGSRRSRRRLAAQSMGGVGAVAAVAVLSASFASGGPKSTGVEAGAAGTSAEAVYVCPAGPNSPIVSEIIRPVPGADEPRVKDPYKPSATCVLMTEPVGPPSGYSTDPPPQSPTVAPVPSGTDWAQVTGPARLQPGTTLKLVREYGDYFLAVATPGSSPDVLYSLGYDGEVQVIPLLRELGFTNLTEHVSTSLSQYGQSMPHAVIDVQDASGHSVLNEDISISTPLTFIDAPGSTAYPSPSGH